MGDLSAGSAVAFGEGGEHFADLNALCARLGTALSGRETVLVKGSRFMRMERVVERLVQADTVTAGDH